MKRYNNFSIFFYFLISMILNVFRVLMQCTYVGNFDSLHQSNKKRRLIGPAKEKALNSIIDKNISSETYREKEATRLMRTGK